MSTMAWVRQAEACWHSLTVGSVVLIEGHFRLDIRMDRDGQKLRPLEMVAERVRFVSGTGVIRAGIPREPAIDAPAQGFEIDAPAQVAEADPPAPEE